MATWKLVSGIISIVLTILVLLQSCVAGVAGRNWRRERKLCRFSRNVCSFADDDRRHHFHCNKKFGKQ